jgi:hypothetical protein
MVNLALRRLTLGVETGSDLPAGHSLNVRPASRWSGKIGAEAPHTGAADRVNIPTEVAVLAKARRAPAPWVIEPVQGVQPGGKERLALLKRPHCLFSIARPSPHARRY